MKWEQFERYILEPERLQWDRAKTDIDCPKCGKRKLWERTDIVLTSYPAQYQYECDCGFVGYSHARYTDLYR